MSVRIVVTRGVLGATGGLFAGVAAACVAALLPWLAEYFAHPYLPAASPFGPSDPVWVLGAIVVVGIAAGTVTGVTAGAVFGVTVKRGQSMTPQFREIWRRPEDRHSPSRSDAPAIPHG